MTPEKHTKRDTRNAIIEAKHPDRHDNWDSDYVGNESYPVYKCLEYIKGMIGDPEWNGWSFRVLAEKDNCYCEEVYSVLRQEEETMEYAELVKKIKEHEKDLAPGSETPLWERFVSRMIELDINPHDPQDQIIDDDEAKWWLTAYEEYNKVGGDVEDLQAFFDTLPEGQQKEGI